MPRHIDANRLKRQYAWWAEAGRKEEKEILDEIIDAQPTVREITTCAAAVLFILLGVLACAVISGKESRKEDEHDGYGQMPHNERGQ